MVNEVFKVYEKNIVCGRKHTLQEAIAAVNEKWKEVVAPVTGFVTYEDLVDSLLC